MSGLLELAERCEAATGPDRELDCRIACAAHRALAGEWRVVEPPFYDQPRFFSGQPGIDWIGYDLLNTAPAYTASLDAATTLVPEGLEWEVGFPGHARVIVRTGPVKSHWSRAATTPALALCAAALRARASADQQSAQDDGGVA